MTWAIIILGFLAVVAVVVMASGGVTVRTTTDVTVGGKRWFKGKKEINEMP